MSQGVDIFLWHDFLDLLHPLFLPQITEIGLSRSNPWCSDCNGKCTQSQGPRVSACDNRDTWRLGLVGVPSPSLPLSPQHVTENVWTTAKLHNWRWEIKSVPHGRWRELACWEQASISCSREEEGQSCVSKDGGCALDGGPPHWPSLPLTFT